MLLHSRRRFHQAFLASFAFAYGIRPTNMQANSPASDLMNLEIVEANNAFAFALLQDFVSAKPTQNQFFSPFSIESALAIALEGARKETASQMGLALRYPGQLKSRADDSWNMDVVRRSFPGISKRLSPPQGESSDRVRKEIMDLRRQLATSNEAAQKLMKGSKFKEASDKRREAQLLADRINTLSRTVDHYEIQNANSLWVDRSFPLSKSLQKNVVEFYSGSTANVCDFQREAEGERVKINDWISEQTRQKIQNMIPKGVIDAMTRLVIANAIYFKGTWAKPFQESATKSLPFTTSSGAQTQVSMMQANGFEVGRYGAFNEDGSPFETPTEVAEGFQEEKGYPSESGFTMAELPYNGDKLSMVAILPTKADGIADLIQFFTLEKWTNCWRTMSERTFNVRLPKVKLESSYDLKPPLIKLGMKNAFDPNTANFSGLTDSKDPSHELFISQVLHKAFVDVNEKGTEAAAATIVAFAPRSVAPQRTRPFIPTFNANHSFLMAIVERETGLILFLGKVEAPTEL